MSTCPFQPTGSEKLTKSEAARDFKAPVIVQGDHELSRLSWAEYYLHRARLQESLNINVGLYALKRCIEALIHRDVARATGRTVHVPFADSKLTLLLKEALEGGARTTVLICASLEPRNAAESIQSLRFGEACSRVEMRAASRSADAAATLRRVVAEIDAEIAAVQRIILKEQRWEKRITTRYDTVELKDNFEAKANYDKGAEDVDDYTAGVMVAQLTLSALDKGGLARFKVSELKEHLGARGLDTKGDKPSLFARLRAALEAAEASQAAAGGSTQTIAHEVVSHVLVGAEEQEARLEALLQRKRELMGEA